MNTRAPEFYKYRHDFSHPGRSAPRTPTYQALLEVSESITRYSDLAELFHDLAQRLRAVAAFDFITVLLYDEAGKLMRLHILELAQPNASTAVPVRRRWNRPAASCGKRSNPCSFPTSSRKPVTRP